MDPASTPDLPVAIIGAGPVGLAAAAHAVRRGLTPLIFERGPSVATALRSWAHVRVFTPWRYNVDAAARDLLLEQGWQAPDPDALPTGADIVRDYLEPLARHPALAPHLRCAADVRAIARAGLDKLTTAGREKAPFQIIWRDADGAEQRTEVRAVLDASGTWDQPNPLGVDGLPVPGEREAQDLIAYGIPDILGHARADYAGRRVLVAGSGHSAINAVLDLLRLQEDAPETRILWALRRNGLQKALGGGLDDKLAERGALGLAARQAVETGRLTVLSPFATERLERAGEALALTARVEGDPRRLTLDRLIIATGSRPDLSLCRELRAALDPNVEAPLALAPLIDPNLHSCGTVPPHGAAELAHPEPGFYIVGSKAYGRAPTFLMMTGYEQVRSVIAEIAGDHAAARDVHLVLPETGVCSTAPRETGAACCAPPTPAIPAASTGCCGVPA
ncbi:FAD-dependent oxidoreductase [Ancylobacter rudongensis]|uniref:Predicted flavoprotein CzcO associated with the cation diffusion facilitator CzcD n=1 Tax=Ancylobacter rudongensis TaxID=177413 RepID=A0A1G4REF1_9HYPH|nr:FAD-dependent oxidoreductase [Ancylobacter rudongensis]SCW55302.1 Predicted flavoprotein CzcO associated with the cation diffusion facilitator CzcD [Ancylobacter rudongensis]